MKTRVEDIPPSKAEAMLEANRRNRPLSEKYIAKLAEDMKAGKWEENGESIKVAKDGTLIDGQHRLWAVVMSRVTIKSVVVTDLDEDVFDTVDTGKPRNLGQALAIHGYANYFQLAASLGWIWRIREKTLFGDTANRSTLMMMLESDKKNIISAVARCEKKSPFRIFPASVIAALYYYFIKKDTVLAEAFVQCIYSGSAEGFPNFHLLREKIIAACGGRNANRLSTGELVGLAVKAWNAHRSGINKTLSTLRWVRPAYGVDSNGKRLWKGGEVLPSIE